MVLVDDSLELWGGIECTVNRVRDEYFDQLEVSGHATRTRDLLVLADVGLRALRYPVLWERTRRPDGSLDFRWADERLALLNELGVEPIVGLVHHGSGPRHTSLLDPSFAPELAEYAAAVARRYPWVRRFTPVNEPLTTARFSGLYGHWYPHGRDDRSFVRALLNQCKAVVLSMQAIRRVNPHAELVQTDDLGHTRSTPELAYQADFDNERRWLSFDLLCGRVDRDHPLFEYLLHSGAREAELEFFLEQPCPPEIVGLNYYVTSERFLDGRVELYAPEQVGGNHSHAYADVEAVRVCADGLVGPCELVKGAARRLKRPIAITEAHLGCTVDQQIAWFSYIVGEARRAKRSGVDIRAVTAWALFGAYDWHCLVTRREGLYEPGAFSLVDGEPIETEYAEFLRTLAQGHHGETVPGWWSLPERLLYDPHPAPRFSGYPAADASDGDELLSEESAA